MASYPELETLMGGWFHQDFDLNGETLEEVIAAYRAVTPGVQQRALAAEIEGYLDEEGDVERDFQLRFNPDVSPTGFAPSTRAFLQRIAALLSEGAGAPQGP
jgi:hypothetical protein